VREPVNLIIRYRKAPHEKCLRFIEIHQSFNYIGVFISNFFYKPLVGCDKIRGVHEYIISTDLLKDECQILLPNPFTVLTGINLDHSSHVFE
jgi:hypothetical protein